jgi:hypothetical protein
LYYYIYKVTDPNTGKFYIGRRKSEIEPELDVNYKGSMYSWAKEEDFNKDILIKEIIVKGIETMEELCELESSIIEENINDPLNKNAHIPGKTFFLKGPLTDKHKKNISNSWKTRKVTDESKKKMSESRKNSKVVKDLCSSEEWRNKISNGIKNSELFKTKMASQERKDKISNSIRNSKKFKESRSSKEFSEKCSKWQKGKPRSEEYMEKWKKSREETTRKKREEEKIYILEILNKYNNDYSLVAEYMSLTLKQLKRKLKNLNII